MAQSGIGSNVLPSKGSVGGDIRNWNDLYGGRYVIPYTNYRQAALEAGVYYMASNPTVGTAIAATGSITAYSEGAGAVGNYFCFYNASTKGTNMILDYIKLLVTVIPTSATTWRMTFCVDNAVARYTSGGSQITPVNANAAGSTATGVTMYAGALTTAVPGSTKRVVGTAILANSVPVALDSYQINFGDNIMSGKGQTTVGSYAISHAPVIVPPGFWLSCLMWGASNAGTPQFEFDVGWMER